MNDWNIIGHDWAVRRLRRQIEDGQLGQSHLFVGLPMVGKTSLAKALACAVLSRGARDPARTKLLVDNLKHPDLIWMEQLEIGSDRAEALRELLHTLSLKPVEGERRVAIVNDVHILIERNSVILKTLEEPNPSSIIILIAPSTDSLLPTITSRCQVLNLRPVSTQRLTEALVARDVDPARAELVARLARGRPGWALRAIEDSALLDERTQRLDELESLFSANRTARFEYAEALAKADDETLQTVLGEWLMYWRDIVRAASAPVAGAHDDADAVRDKLHNVDRMEAIVRVAKSVDAVVAVHMVRETANTLKRIQQNASARLALDVLLLNMPVV
jgi:DNA polymerase-3 subunit delta'